MVIVVSGRPVPAVRMTQRSKWTNKQAMRYLEYKTKVGWAAKAARVPKFEGDVEVIAAAYLYGKREPDADNLAKAFLDALNGIAWIDDRQVRKLAIEKIRVDSVAEEKAEIRIREIGRETK